MNHSAAGPAVANHGGFFKDGGRRLFIVVTLSALAVFYLIFLIFPIAYSFAMSLFKWNPYVGSSDFIATDNYITALKDELFWKSLKNTIFFTAITVFATTFLGLIFAIFINGIKRFKSFFRTVYFMPVITSMVAVSIIWQWLYDPQIGFFNRMLSAVGLPELNWLKDPFLAMPSIILMTIWKDFGYSVVIFMAGLGTIPKSIYETAQLDGASGWNIFWRITLPCVKPTTVFVLVTGTIGYLQSFTQMYMLTRGGPGTETFTLSYMIYNEAFGGKYNFGYASAVSFLLFIVILTFSLIQIRVARMDWGY